MSSGTHIIQRALQNIGVHSLIQPASPESIVEGMHRLNSLMQRWLSRGINLGTMPLEAPGDELSEPMDATSAIIDNLSIDMASQFSAVVTIDLRKSARDGLTLLKRSPYQPLNVPKRVVSTTMPLGQGNLLNGENTFAGEDYTLG